MVSGFRQKKINSIERVGEILCSEREKRDKTLTEIAGEIRIREEHLHNLEEGYYDNLPPDVYTKGFLKTYADYLGLNSAKLIRMYEKESGIKDHLERSQGRVEAEPKQVKPPLITPRLLKLAAVVIIVAAAVSYLVWQFSNFSRNPELALEVPVNDVTVEVDRITFKGSAEREGELTINGQGVYIDEKGSFVEEIALQEGLNTITVMVRDRQGRETTLTRQILREVSPPPPEKESGEGEDVTEESPEDTGDEVEDEVS